MPFLVVDAAGTQISPAMCIVYINEHISECDINPWRVYNVVIAICDRGVTNSGGP